MEKNGQQTRDQMDGGLEVSDKIRDCKLVNYDSEKILLETNLTMPQESRKISSGSTENDSEVNKDSKRKRRWKKIKNKKNTMDEVQCMDDTMMHMGSTENLGEGDVKNKRDRKGKWVTKEKKNKDETQSMDQADCMLKLHLPDRDHGRGIDGNLTENECTDQESEFSVSEESSLSDLVKDNENPSDLYKDEEIASLSDGLEVSNNKVSSDLVEDKSGSLMSPTEVETKLFPCENQHSPHLNQMAGENVKFENGLSEASNEIFVDQGKCSAEVRSIFATSNEVMTHLASPPNGEEAGCSSKDLGQYLRVAPVASIKRKLLVLDVNGLLANIVMPAPKDCKGDTHILGRAIFRRPFCDDFLKFCFQNFDVGVWSSRSKKIIDRVVDYLLGDLKDKLLFCWDMAHSTQSGFKTLENNHKPLVFKELRKIWENEDPNLPWKKGDYDESNTLLLDDSPYKALLNPLYTAIFPRSFNYEDKNDNSLGPGGDLRVYLEGLLTSENVQKYIEQNPFGQSAINETSVTWGFYSGVLQTLSRHSEDNTSTLLPTLSHH